jgi:hypothetical protein
MTTQTRTHKWVGFHYGTHLFYSLDPTTPSVLRLKWAKGQWHGDLYENGRLVAGVVTEAPRQGPPRPSDEEASDLVAILTETPR